VEGIAKRAIIRTTNMATFASSVFGANGVGFWELNDNFIDTFTPEDEPLQREPGRLYLDLKTQIYASAISQPIGESTRRGVQEFASPFGSSTKEELLEYLFPHDVDEFLLSRHPERPLTPSEEEFILLFNMRRDYLMDASSDIITEKHVWEDFLLSLSTHLNSDYGALIVS
jgi:hypothetical protein